MQRVRNSALSSFIVCQGSYLSVNDPNWLLCFNRSTFILIAATILGHLYLVVFLLTKNVLLFEGYFEP